MAVSVDSVALEAAGSPPPVVAGWTAVVGGCALAGAERQSGRLRLAEAWGLGQLELAWILMAAAAYLKSVSIPEDVRKGLTPVQLENMDVSMPGLLLVVSLDPNSTFQSLAEWLHYWHWE